MAELLDIGMLLIFLCACLATFIGYSIPTVFIKFATRYQGRALEALDYIPVLIWAEEDNQVVWKNKAFKTLNQLFPYDLNNQSFKQNQNIRHLKNRVQLDRVGEKEPFYFDISMVEVRNRKYYCAISALAAMTAEQDRQRFIQLLSQTFADIPIGIMVFDKNQRIILFNPAATNSMTLRPDWLAAKPPLGDILDRLRERGIIAEPKDYKEWRDDILENKAERCVYNWNMSDGRVFRILKQTNSYGAVTLIIENITKHVESERLYTQQIASLGNVINALDGVVVVFDAIGRLLFVNEKFATMWGVDPQNITIVELYDLWLANTRPTPVWGEIKEFISQNEERSAWNAHVILRNGGDLNINIVPLPHKQTMVEFSDMDLTKSR